MMRKINPKSSDADSYKYSILISLHYYDIPFQPERISKLKPHEIKYNFIHITPTEFETNNSNISLTIYDENNKKIYHTKYDSTNQVHIVQLKNNRYAAIKPLKNKFTQLEKILKYFSHKEIKEYILYHIHINNSIDSNDINDLNDTNDTNDSNDTNNSSDSINNYSCVFVFYLVNIGVISFFS